ncbi:MAG: apolipoprotein N-acyltransferase [Acidothermaceae bacterium]
MAEQLARELKLTPPDDGASSTVRPAAATGDARADATQPHRRWRGKHSPRAHSHQGYSRRHAPSRAAVVAIGVAFVSGLSLDAAFAPLAWWPVAVPATAAVMLAVRGRSWRGGLAVGFAFGLGEFVPLLAWLHVVTPLAWIVLAVVEAAYLAVLGAALSRIVGRLPGWPVWAAFLWVGEELVRARWPLGGFGWGRLAFSQPDTPFTSYASVAGAPLVTFAVALSAGLLAAGVYGGWRSRSRIRTSTAVAVLPLAAVVGAAAVPAAAAFIPRPTSGRLIQVAVVQGNVPHPGTHFLGRAEEVLDNHLAETGVLADGIANGSYARPQVVLWPENASDVDPLNDASVYAKIEAATRSVGAPILVGAVLDAGKSHVSNTGIVWSPTTGPGERYTKRHLVPFGEYIPWRGLVSHLTSLTSLVPENFVPGHTVGALDIGPTTIADVMCFEVAFDDAVRSGVTAGGRIIVVQTNNATYMGTAETRQQLAMSQLRAVEHGRSVVVAATSGISAIVSPDGHVVTQTRELTPAIIDQPVIERSQLTIADHLGATPEWVMGILGGLAIIAGIALPALSGASTRRRPAKEN